MKRLLFVAGFSPAFILMLGIQISVAGSATWKTSPTSGDWNTATNWTPQTIPNGPSDTARFATSNTTSVSLSANTEVNGIIFNAGASAFTTTANPAIILTISGTGITNNSGITQNFMTAVDGAGNLGTIAFTNSATAGVRTVFTNIGSQVASLFPLAGTTEFFDTSTAGNGVFINDGGTVSGAKGGHTQFRGTASGRNGTFINNGGLVNSAFGGTTEFFDTSTAGSGTYNNNGSTVGGAGSGATIFNNSSTAGNGTFTITGAIVSGAGGGHIGFHDTSTADNGTFTTTGAAVLGAGGGMMLFDGNSTAGNGTFIIDRGAVSGASGGQTIFFDSSTAGNGTFTNNGTIFFGIDSTAGDGQFTTNSGAFSDARGGQIAVFHFASAGNGIFIINGSAVTGLNVAAIVSFQEDATASNATLIANGGVGGGVGGRISFSGDSDGGTARVAVFGNGNLVISLHNAPGVTVGSIEGNGDVFLGARNLTVGSNNLSTSFSGVIQDGGPNFGTGGSLTKVGTGTLTVTKPNTYTGGTIINRGKLVITNTSGFGTGSGAVQVNAGRLGGTGRIAGDVTIGTGSGTGAILSPGQNPIRPGTLTIRSALTFNSDATYNFGLKASTATADKVVAHRVTINSGAIFSFVALGSGTLPTGTVFIAIDNTAVAPITGRFSNLPDGSTFTANGNTYQVSYEGGDGNDLTLRVVP